MNMQAKAWVLALALALSAPTGIHAAELKTIEVGFNQIQVKVNGDTVKSNNLLYEGTTYIPIRDVAAMLGVAANYYSKNKTAYIGQLGAGEFTDADTEIDSWDIVTPAKPSNDPIQSSGVQSIQAGLNEIQVKVNGQKLEAGNILYKGTTYVGIRAVADSLGLYVGFDPAASTALISASPIPETPAAPSKAEEPPASVHPVSKLYSEPASGTMQGWMLLKGYPYEGAARIYYQQDGSILRTKIEDIRSYDPNQIVEWKDENGRVRKNKVKDLYQVFGTFSNKYTDEWLYSTFGALYRDWLWVSTLDATAVVESFLKETGQIKKSPGATLTPDTQVKVERENLEGDTDFLNIIQGSLKGNSK